MNDTSFSFSTIYQHHQDWQTEHAAWQADNERWQAEQQAALETVKQLEQGLLDHGHALVEHAKSTTLAHAEAIAADKQALGEYEQMGEHQGFHEFLNCTHRAFTDCHLQQRQAHEQIAKLHRQMMAQVAALKEALEESL